VLVSRVRGWRAGRWRPPRVMRLAAENSRSRRRLGEAAVRGEVPPFESYRASPKPGSLTCAIAGRAEVRWRRWRRHGPRSPKKSHNRFRPGPPSRAGIWARANRPRCDRWQCSWASARRPAVRRHRQGRDQGRLGPQRPRRKHPADLGDNPVPSAEITKRGRRMTKNQARTGRSRRAEANEPSRR
jgi:hypothetical protein